MLNLNYPKFRRQSFYLGTVSQTGMPYINQIMNAPSLKEESKQQEKLGNIFMIKKTYPT